MTYIFSHSAPAPKQIHDAKNRFSFNGHWVAGGFHHRGDSRHLEQVGTCTRVRVRPDLLPLVHGRRHHARLLPRLALHALRVLPNLARGVEASEESPDDGAAGRNIRLEIRASEFNKKILHMEIAIFSPRFSFLFCKLRKSSAAISFQFSFSPFENCTTRNPLSRRLLQNPILIQFLPFSDGSFDSRLLHNLLAAVFHRRLLANLQAD